MMDSLVDQSYSKNSRVHKIRRLVGNSAEARGLIKDYGDMVRILPSEFSIEAMKRLKVHMKTKLVNPDKFY